MNTASSLSQIPYEVSCNAFPRSKMFNVLSYSPQTGQSGSTVTIDTLFNNINWTHDVHIRIVIGNKPIHTEIKSIGGNVPNLWRCTGFVPEFEVHKNSLAHTVSITIQAVDTGNHVLDTVTFGRFTYQENGLSLLEPGVFDVPRRGNIHLSATQPHTAHSVPPHQEVHSRNSPAPLKCQTSKSTFPEYKRELRRHEPDQGYDFDPVSLVFETKVSLADLGKDLSEEELCQGRRMIEFERKEVGDKLSLSFGRISRQDYKEGLVVVSCIYREETHDTWYTSVDMIRLVEYIAQTQFSSEEKSRIRRNLEFLHPTTVSRTGMPKFFQTLMDFPLPKPRVIEKDIKVFQWNSLEAGLKKVLEKYTWVSEPASATGTTNPSPQPPEAGLPANKFEDASQLPAPHSFGTPASSDGTNTPDSLGQPGLMSNMLIDPRWVQSHGDRVGLMTSPYVGGGAMSSTGPQSHITPAEVGNNNQTANPFHDLEFITSPGHIVWC